MERGVSVHCWWQREESWRFPEAKRQLAVKSKWNTRPPGGSKVTATEADTVFSEKLVFPLSSRS